MSGLTMSPQLLQLFRQNLMSQSSPMSMGMRSMGGLKRCPKGKRRRTVSVKRRLCRKGRGVVLGGCECCMGRGCANCMGMGFIGGGNRWITCLRKMKRAKVPIKQRVSKCRAVKSQGYPGYRGPKKSPAKKKSVGKKKVSPQASQALSDYQQILKSLRSMNPNGNYRALQKEASKIYKSGQY